MDENANELVRHPFSQLSVRATSVGRLVCAGGYAEEARARGTAGGAGEVRTPFPYPGLTSRTISLDADAEIFFLIRLLHLEMSSSRFSSEGTLIH